MRLVLLCGMQEPKRETGAKARDKRWRLANPDKVRERMARFLAANPNYMRDYHQKRRQAA